jgi:hypothetical protein
MIVDRYLAQDEVTVHGNQKPARSRPDQANESGIFGEADPVRFGSGRFLFVVAEVYMGGGAARATGRVSLVYAEKKG